MKPAGTATSDDAATLSFLKDRLRDTADRLGADSRMVENELIPPKRVYTTEKMRVMLDDGTRRSLTAIVVLHCAPYQPTYHHPYKGGVRFSPSVTTELLEALAMEMTLKCAVTNLQLGGGKSGVRLDKEPYLYSQAELERITEAFCETYAREDAVINPHFYVPAPDYGTNSRLMDVLDAKFWEIVKPAPDGTPVTGKGLESGGIPGREEATGRGALIVLQELLQAKRISLPQNPRVIVQGLGNVGGHFIRLAQQDPEFKRTMRIKIVGVSNISGAVYNPKGIPYEKLAALKDASLEALGGEHLDTARKNELLTMPCDILVPAATGSAITAANAPDIEAKVILELANGPTTHDADAILRERKIIVVPDILANAGGVTVSRSEWSHGFGNPPHAVELHKTEIEIRMLLAQVMRVATEYVCQAADEYHANDLREAAWLAGVQRIMHGLYRKHGKHYYDTPLRNWDAIIARS